MLGACPAQPPAREKAAFGPKRYLYLFAPNGQDQELRRQQAYLTSEMPGCVERDLEIRVDTQTASPARVRWGISEPAFTLLLIGKDGGEKFRSPEAVPPGRLFALIDAMPMRRQEIESQKAKPK
ncbi:MAG: hypothetical protein OHK0053_22450 [Microscillaceae bacterium]